MLRSLRLLLAGLWLAIALAWMGVGLASAAAPRIDVLQVKGAIVPVVASYIDRGITQAEAEGAALCIIELDTPGGLFSTTQDIVQRILRAQVPVVVYVSPAGGNAGSAGVFITMSSHVAAMAPGTRIGAASPITLSGEGTSETLQRKITEDAVAQLKSLANQRGRSQEWAEKAVRESVSITDEEALGKKVIEIRALDRNSLITQLDGLEVTLGGDRRITLSTKGYVVKGNEMTPFENFLRVISDPNIAYILLSLALSAIFLELANPGAIFPGVIGGISLLLALYSLSVLQASWAGAFLIGLAFVFFLAEVLVTSHGLLTAGGIASMVAGSLLLFSGQPSGLDVDRRLIAVIVIGVAAFFIFAVTAVVRAHRRRAATGWEGLVGKVARARTPLDPEGFVFLEGERWTARSEEGRVEEGEEVVVTRVEGMKLVVKKSRAGGA